VNVEAANELASQLDLDVDHVGVCHACLCAVSFAIEGGDDRDIRRETNRMTPDLWADGLALPAQLALEQARRAGLPHAEEALADVLNRGPRSTIAKSIVRRLGADLAARAREDRAGRGWER
jgi:hypothetical protein